MEAVLWGTKKGRWQWWGTHDILLLNCRNCYNNPHKIWIALNIFSFLGWYPWPSSHVSSLWSSVISNQILPVIKSIFSSRLVIAQIWSACNCMQKKLKVLLELPVQHLFSHEICKLIGSTPKSLVKWRCFFSVFTVWLYNVFWLACQPAILVFFCSWFSYLLHLQDLVWKFCAWRDLMVSKKKKTIFLRIAPSPSAK